MRVGSPQVLVVDDDEGIRTTVAEILRSEGYEVDEAEDGDVALEKLSRNDVGVLLLDIRMPRVDGIEVLEALDEPPVVLLVSAFTVTDEIRTRTEGKVFEYLRKPVAPDRLIRVVKDGMDEALARSGEIPGRGAD